MPDSIIPAPKSVAEEESLILSTMQLLLSEKRTALSGLRTGLAVFAFPLSVFSVLIATSHFYEAMQVLHWLIPLLLITLGLVVLAVYLVTRSVRRLWYYDRVIRDYKKKHTVLALLLG